MEVPDSGSDNENQDPEEVDDKQLDFVRLLKNRKVLPDKSQVPSVKTAKKKAAAELLTILEQNYGTRMTDAKLMKKINNMKTKVKEKSDRSKTGNKNICLVQWEKEMLALVGAESNPVFTEIPGAKSVGLPSRSANPDDQNLDGNLQGPSRLPSSSSSSSTLPPKPPEAKKTEEGARIPSLSGDGRNQSPLNLSTTAAGSHGAAKTNSSETRKGDRQPIICCT